MTNDLLDLVASKSVHLDYNPGDITVLYSGNFDNGMRASYYADIIKYRSGVRIINNTEAAAFLESPV